MKTVEILVLAAVLLLAGCGGSQSRLTITGSSTMAPMIADMADIFEQETGRRADVHSGGSARGINDTLDGLADIGMSSRALISQEKSTGLVAKTVAWDGIAVIVHDENPVAELDRDQLRSIYRGEVNNWRQVGGHDREVIVVNKAEGHSTLRLFLEFFDLDSYELQADLVAGENQQVILYVSGNPGSIGYVSIGAAQEAAAQGENLRLLPLDGVPAVVEAVQSGRYPLRRELNLVTVGRPPSLVAEFIKMARSESLHAVVEEHHFVPVSP